MNSATVLSPSAATNKYVADPPVHGSIYKHALRFENGVFVR